MKLMGGPHIGKTTDNILCKDSQFLEVKLRALWCALRPSTAGPLLHHVIPYLLGTQGVPPFQ
eukprot:660640-Hanusia_phi.AAC.1